MNNTVKNAFFGFPKVKWLHLTGKVTNLRLSCEILSGIIMPESLKSVNFLELFEK